MAHIKKHILFILLTFLLMSAHSAWGATQLSDSASVSLLTCSPYEAEVFTVYGHAAMRVKDADNKIDLIFNYGIFSFDKPNFVYRFAKGETDYQLGIAEYRDYIIEYEMRGSSVTEQVLNLTQAEKQRIWDLLIENYKPENREYRYNFFFDNCATRLAAIVEKSVNGKIQYTQPRQLVTFRDMINHCTRNHPWLTFGCDLALGSGTDRWATAHEQMFLPDNLQKAFSGATVTTSDKGTRQLIQSVNVIAADPQEPVEQTLFTPMFCALALLILTALLTLIEWRRHSYFRWLDVLLFAAVGIGGIIIAFLVFFSEHPCTSPNWVLLYFHPLHLVAAAMILLKKMKGAVNWYQMINFAALTLMLVCWHFIPQHLNTALIPMVATLWLRSGSYLLNRQR